MFFVLFFVFIAKFSDQFYSMNNTCILCSKSLQCLKSEMVPLHQFFFHIHADQLEQEHTLIWDNFVPSTINSTTTSSRWNLMSLWHYAFQIVDVTKLT